MSNTIAHRPHVHHHIPLLPILAVIAAIAVATVVIWAVNQPEPVTITTGGESVTVPLAQPGAVAAPESPVFRHHEAARKHGDQMNRAYAYGRLHQVDGTGTGPVGTYPYGRGSYEGFDNLR